MQNKGFDQIFPVDDKGVPLLDMTTNLEDLWKGMEAQVDAGRTKSIGLSNFNQKQIKRILDSCRIPPANLQVELYIYLQQKELVSFCKQNGVTVCAYSPLGSPGQKAFYEKLGESTEWLLTPLEDPVIKEIAKKYNKQPSQVLLRYMIEYGVATIPKSTNPTRIKENFDVFDFELTKEESEKIRALDRGEDGRMFDGKNSRGIFKLLSKHPESAFPK
ncbi:aldo-keto reductase family 1 member A1 [Halyomorpha halys]|uniref:aldo-keto reductase family 1 member A1 n=1 Tax=Halyomorpha halys TaxID=286706 RepID=UPI0034D356DC